MKYKYKEPKAMREIHKIREKIYEETKHLSTEERVKLIHERVDNFLKERNLTHLKVKA